MKTTTKTNSRLAIVVSILLAGANASAIGMVTVLSLNSVSQLPL